MLLSSISLTGEGGPDPVSHGLLPYLNLDKRGGGGFDSKLRATFYRVIHHLFQRLPVATDLSSLGGGRTVTSSDPSTDPHRHPEPPFGGSLTEIFSDPSTGGLVVTLNDPPAGTSNHGDTHGVLTVQGDLVRPSFRATLLLPFGKGGGRTEVAGDDYHEWSTVVTSLRVSQDEVLVVHPSLPRKPYVSVT